jgi:hypothetical protein
MDEMTTSQAVRAYETHPNVLNRLILVGRLKAHKNADGHWLINRESLECWNRNRTRRRLGPAELKERSAKLEAALAGADQSKDGGESIP